MRRARPHGAGVDGLIAAGLVALVASVVAVVSGCAAPAGTAPSAAVVVESAPVVAAKSAVPPPELGPDLSGLPTVYHVNVIPGLPGMDGLTPLRNDDPASGVWRLARVIRDTAAYDAPDGSPLGTLRTHTFQALTTLPVVDATDDGWLRVMVPARAALPSQDPSLVNNRTAWIRERDTEATGTDWRLTVDTAAQTLTIDDGTGPRVMPVIATGSPSRPTPKGLQYVVGTFWEQPGTYTPLTILLSSQSEAIDDYDRKTGTSATAIHTTPLKSRGEVSNGCIRVSPEVLALLWKKVPAGALVEIR